MTAEFWRMGATPVPCTGIGRMAQYRAAEQRQILLRHRRTEAGAGPGGHQQGVHRHPGLRPPKRGRRLDYFRRLSKAKAPPPAKTK